MRFRVDYFGRRRRGCLGDEALVQEQQQQQQSDVSLFFHGILNEGNSYW